MTKRKRTNFIESSKDIPDMKVAKTTSQLAQIKASSIERSGDYKSVDVYNGKEEVAFSVHKENGGYNIVSQSCIIPNGAINLLERTLR